MSDQKKPGDMISRMLEKKRKQKFLASQANGDDVSEGYDIKLPSLRRLINEQAKQDFLEPEKSENMPNNENGSKKKNRRNASLKENIDKSCKTTQKKSTENSLNCSFCPFIASSLDALKYHARLHSGGGLHQHISSTSKNVEMPRPAPNRDPLKISHLAKVHSERRKDIPQPIKLANGNILQLNEEEVKELVNNREYIMTAASTSFGLVKGDINEVKCVEKNEFVLALKHVSCQFCSYTTTKRYQLRRHLNSHFRLRTFKCSECSYGTHRKDHLSRHKIVHDKNKTLKCYKCMFGTDDQDVMIKHIEDHYKYKENKCTDCQFKTYSREEFKAHLKKCGALHFSCTQCDYVSKSRVKLRCHLRYHL